MRHRPDIALVAPVPRVQTRVRLNKFARAYISEGWRVAFVGWERTSQDMDLPERPELEVTIAHRGGGYASRGLPVHYVLWVLKSAVRLVRLAPRRVHALGLESALACLCLKLVRPSTVLILDDADRLSMCRSLPDRPLRVLRWFERRFSQVSDLQIVPTLLRYPDGLRCRHVAVVPNMPSEDALSGAERVRSGLDKEKFNVLITGWIGDSRGAGLLEDLAEHFANHPLIRFIAAGRVTGHAASRLVAKANVDYRGQVSNEEALALCRDSSLVVTMYDPAIPINKYAAPNKWGDCLAYGVPFLVNSEVATAKPYVECGAAFAFDYTRPCDAAAIIRRLAENSNQFEIAKSAALRAGTSAPTFESLIQSQIVSRLRGVSK